MASPEYEQEGQTRNQQLRAMASTSPKGPARAGRYAQRFVEQHAPVLELTRSMSARQIPSTLVDDLSPAETLEVYAHMRAHVPIEQLGALDALAASLLED